MIPHAPVDAEEWRPIPGWEGIYEASNFGRIRSVERSYIDASGALRTFPSTIRTPSSDWRGCQCVRLCYRGAQITKTVHGLVALTFIGPRPDGMEIAHNDGDPSNNHLSNLRYATPSENEHDKRRHGTNYQVNKTHCPHGHPYDEENTRYERNGRRKCRTCQRRRMREYYARTKRGRQSEVAA